MTHPQEYELLALHFREITGTAPSSIVPLRPHASERRIYRLSAGSNSFIGVINPSRKENDAFVSFAHFFLQKGLPVPEIYLYKPDAHLYLEQDLGDETLFDFIQAARKQTGDSFPTRAEELYRRSIEWLPQFQIACAKDFDFSQCYPEQHLLPGTFTRDCTSFATDLVARIIPSFDITRLASDFSALIAHLEQAHSSFFVYRDFQSRNIMNCSGTPYFIDFQSGRQGALQYDLVSLLYQSSVQLPADVRTRLVQYYLTVASQYVDLDQQSFYRYYPGFIISRMLQVLGVYGRQGLVAGKEYFIQSIPAALTTLSHELVQPELPVKLPALQLCAELLVQAFARNTPA
jgi:aminoglycoside/choline kinase family phosphotransferase